MIFGGDTEICFVILKEKDKKENKKKELMRKAWWFLWVLPTNEMSGMCTRVFEGCINLDFKIRIRNLFFLYLLAFCFRWIIFLLDYENSKWRYLDRRLHTEVGTLFELSKLDLASLIIFKWNKTYHQFLGYHLFFHM